MKINFLIVALLLVSTSWNCQKVTDNLQAHYEFNGNLLDETDFSHDLEISSGSISYSREPKGDESLVLDGSVQIRTARSFDNSSYQEISISLWFKSSTIRSVDQIMLQGAFLGFGILIAPHTGKVMGFFDGTSRGSIQSQKSLTDGEWHHVVLQSIGYKTFLYVDGELNASMVEPLAVGNGRYNNRLYIGRSNYGVRPFIGSLNDIRIYNRSLTQEEIDQLWYDIGDNDLIH
ncbi:MAG: LamG domain-containing protein [Bacteroidota bacterium]